MTALFSIMFKAMGFFNCVLSFELYEILLISIGNLNVTGRNSLSQSRSLISHSNAQAGRPS